MGYYKNRDWLYKKYIEEHLTCEKIAKLCNCHLRTIHQWLVKFNIPRRKAGQKWSDERKEWQRQWNKTHGIRPPVHKWNPLDRLLMSYQRREENGSAWKGGVSVLNIVKRQSLEYKAWRTEIYKRDNYTCQICGNKKGGYLIAHHIKSFAEYPDLRFNVNNGVTVCIDCHCVLHNFRRRQPIRRNKIAKKRET